MGSKKKAYKAVYRAVQRGILVRPKRCSKCGKSDPKRSDGVTAIQAHHYKGYDYPLDVKWLCVKCHHIFDKRVSGELHYNSKLTFAEIETIRRRYSKQSNNNRGPRPNSYRSLAREFGVTAPTIVKIVKSVGWRLG